MSSFSSTIPILLPFIFEVMQSLFRISQSGLIVNFMWVHHSVEGHEEADRLAKQALKHVQTDIKVSMSKTEVKGLIANEIRNGRRSGIVEEIPQ